MRARTKRKRPGKSRTDAKTPERQISRSLSLMMMIDSMNSRRPFNGNPNTSRQSSRSGNCAMPTPFVAQLCAHLLQSLAGLRSARPRVPRNQSKELAASDAEEEGAWRTGGSRRGTFSVSALDDSGHGGTPAAPSLRRGQQLVDRGLERRIRLRRRPAGSPSSRSRCAGHTNEECRRAGDLEPLSFRQVLADRVRVLSALEAPLESASCRAPAPGACCVKSSRPSCRWFAKSPTYICQFTCPDRARSESPRRP